MVLAVTPEPTKALHQLTGWALERGRELESLSVRRPSLEDIYLELTEPPADEHGAE
jgi:ABC-2 type transport system ATP-binding protein